MSVYKIYAPDVINGNVTAYAITCLSILVLVFGQIENAKEFSMKAKEYHNCGLALSKLYNELRVFKILKDNSSLDDKKKFAEELSDKYQRILERHENHFPIDHDMFKVSKFEYHELDKWDVLKIRIRYYFHTAFIYHALIIFPPIIILFLMWYNAT